MHLRHTTCVLFLCLSACSGGSSSGGPSAGQCQPPSLRCGDACVDPGTDPAHCGGCGRACETGDSCSDGSCVPTCAAPRIVCGTGAEARCVDPSRDATACGGCETACAPGETCVDGSCALACADGETACAGVCVNLSADDLHCGDCNSACSGGTGCVDGACACPAGREPCNDSCVDLATDEHHCGGCGTACVPGQTCAAGACVCPSGQVECAGTCVDVDADPDHCAGCGLACPDGAVCLAGACAPPACTGELLLPGPALVDFGKALLGFGLGDLDLDGDPDLLVTPMASLVQELVWLENRGDGRFSPARTIERMTNGATQVLVGDLDGGGSADVVTCTAGAAYVRVIRDATTAPRSLAPSPPGLVPTGCALADLDGDGDTDVAVHVRATGRSEVHVLAAGPGADPAWAASPYVAGLGAGDHRLAGGDLDGDGDGDLVLASAIALEILRSGPSGTVRQTLPLATPTSGLELADLDDDGDLDVALSAHRLFENDGTGTFAPWAGALPAPSDGPLAVADLDGDHLPEVLSILPGKLTVLRNAAGGAFSGTDTFPVHAVGGQPLAADLDGDGAVDLAVSHGGAGSISLLFGRDAGFVGPVSYAGLGGTAPSLVAGRFDEGAGIDLLALPDAGNALQAVLSTAAGPGEPSIVELPEVGGSLVAADLDDDGREELLVVGVGVDNLYVSDFVSPSSLQPLRTLATGGRPSAAVALGAPAEPGFAIAVLEQDPPAVRFFPRGLQAGAWTVGLAGIPRTGSSGDLDGDGEADLVMATETGVLALLGNGPGAMRAGPFAPVDTGRLAVGDLDGDGRDDVVAAHRFLPELHVLLSRGGTFEVRVFASGGAPGAVALADLDDDGVLDVIAANQGLGTVHRHAGTGDGGLSPAQAWPTFRRRVTDLGPAAMVVRDLDGDLREDVAILGADELRILPSGCRR